MGERVVEQSMLGSSESRVFRLSLVRIVLLNAGQAFLLTTVMVMFFAVRGDSLSRDSLMPVFFAVLLASVLRAAVWRDTRSIAVDPLSVTGPSSNGGRGTIFFAAMDRERSASRSWLDVAMGYQSVYSRSGEAISFSRREFDPDELRALLALLGLDDEHAWRA